MSKRNRDILADIAKNKSKINDAIAKQESSGSTSRDESYWSPPWNAKTKKEKAVIAFLPFSNIYLDSAAQNHNSSPYIVSSLHTNMKGTKGKQYWNIHCPKDHSLVSGQDTCPFCEQFFVFHNDEDMDKAQKDSVKAKTKIGRKQSFVANIIVLKNESNQEEEGKLFKWRFGTQIKDLLVAKLDPEDEEDGNCFFFNPDDITPFTVIVDGTNSEYRQYLKSKFKASEGKSIAEYVMPKATEKKKDEFIDNLPLSSVEDIINLKIYKTEDEQAKILEDVLINSGVVKAEDITRVESSKPEEEPEEEDFDDGNEAEEAEEVVLDEETEEDDVDLDNLFDEDDE